MRSNNSGLILDLLTVKRLPVSENNLSEGVDAARMPNIFLANWLIIGNFSFLSFHQAYGSFSNRISSNAKYSTTSFSATVRLVKASKSDHFFHCCDGAEGKGVELDWFNFIASYFLYNSFSASFFYSCIANFNFLKRGSRRAARRASEDVGLK